jgi:hemerythrin
MLKISYYFMLINDIFRILEVWGINMTNVNNELITWTKQLECGVKLIDNQHKELVNLVNDMFKHVTGDKQEHDYFNKVIHKAAEHVRTHFFTEEKIMLLTNFEGLQEHKKEHEIFILTVVKMIRDYEAGKRLTLSSFTRFLKDWILSHITLVDRQYFDYLRKIATFKEDGKLSITNDDVPRNKVDMHP